MKLSLQAFEASFCASLLLRRLLLRVRAR